jgi:hypothetical protein
MKTTLAFPLLLLLAIITCKKPTASLNSTAWEEYTNPVITPAVLRDTLPVKYYALLSAQEIHGIKVSYPSGNHTSYFEYVADAENVLRTISALPFKRTNALVDAACRMSQLPFSLTGKTILSQEETAAAQFFWNINPNDYIHYECLKSPARHTLLIHKRTKRILHRIESIS